MMPFNVVLTFGFVNEMLRVTFEANAIEQRQAWVELTIRDG